MDQHLLNQILNALTKAHGTTLYDVVLQTLRSRDARHSCHRASILDRMTDLFNLLSEQSPQRLEVAVITIAAATYRNEVQDLIQPQTGFHFTGNKTNLSQLETFSITQMGVKIREVAPNLWNLLGILLDADPNRRRTAPSGEAMDEDVEMELADIATAVNGNDEGSEEEESGDESGGEANAGDEGVGNDGEQLGDRSNLEPLLKKRCYRKQNRARRNGILLFIKRVLITVIIGNSSNERFNALQCVIGFFLESKCAAEGIIELFAHMGISVSTQTTRNLVRSLTKSAAERNRHLPPSQFIYDNFDMDFKVAQPTVGSRGSHASMTSAIFAPYADLRPGDLTFTKELHAKSRFNKDLLPGNPLIYTPHIRDIIPKRELENGLHALSKAFAWHMRAILLQQDQSFAKYLPMLGLPEAINSLPVTRTIQYPASAINADEGSHDGNWQVFENILKQGGVPDARLEDDVILVHGDLATKERIDGLRKMRTIESESKGQLAFVIFSPGLFHLKMAATDAYWRAHVQPCEGREDTAGFFDYVRHLRPKETAKFINGPGFRRLHDSIHHATWLDVLDCFRLEFKARGFQSREAFALSNPTWDSIIKISDEIVHKYIPGDDFGDIREQDNSVRDLVFENTSLRKQHGLLYLELSHAMNYGDVGRILRVLPYWIAVFKSTGKSKYAAHMIQFITDLDHVYPKRLKDVLLRNWLCNPTGKADGWRGWDWLQERNNLYTKVIFAGYGSNRTQQLVMSRSILIEVYRSAHQIIENNFYLTHRTIRHSSPKMTRTLEHLSSYIADNNHNPHIFTTGRTARHQVTDLVTTGFAMLSEDADLCKGDTNVEDTGTGVTTGNDIGIN